MSRIAISMGAVAALASAGPLGAHHSISTVDITTPIWVKGTVVRYEISKEALPRLLENHTTEAARQRRRVRAASRNGQPVSPACPHCGQVGRQWRRNPTATGLEMAMCGGCRKIYWPGAMRRSARKSTFSRGWTRLVSIRQTSACQALARESQRMSNGLRARSPSGV